MATYTSNYNLEKPEASDPFGDFRQSYNDNLDIIDQNLGGGGGGGGHTIIDPNGSDMAQRAGLQFMGSCSVTDDAVNDKTVVNISGGNVYGAFLDPSRVIYSAFTFDSSAHTWTATEDVILTDNLYPVDGSTASYILIDGKGVFASYTFGDPFVYVKKGQVITYRGKSGSNMKAYGILQGTNGIFAPVIYSDTERKIGIWRDNKPLYQKTVTFDGARSHGSNVFSTGILDAEEIVSISGMASYASGGVNSKWIPFTFSDDSTQNGITNAVLKINSFLRSTGEIYAYIGADYQSTYAINRVRITIQYTKTTDTAGSGDWNTDGVPTVHYDTSEKVIGTYLGKPLYQITYSGLSLVCTNANQSYATNTDWGNIKKIVHSDIIDQYGQSCAGSVVYTGTPAKLAVYMQMPNRTVTDITIQYTKTTD